MALCIAVIPLLATIKYKIVAEYQSCLLNDVKSYSVHVEEESTKA